MSAWIDVNDVNFNQKVIQSSLPALVEFGAPWCQPCKRLEPELEKMQEALDGKMQLFHVNVDESPDLAVRLGIMSVPTIILFIQGREQERSQGLQSLARLMEKFGRYIK